MSDTNMTEKGSIWERKFTRRQVLVGAGATAASLLTATCSPAPDAQPVSNQSSSPTPELTPVSVPTKTKDKVGAVSATPKVDSLDQTKKPEATEVPWQPGDAEPRRIGKIDLTKKYKSKIVVNGAVHEHEFDPKPQDNPDWFNQDEITIFNQVNSAELLGSRNWALQINTDIKGVTASLEHSAFADDGKGGYERLPWEWAMKYRGIKGETDQLRKGLEGELSQIDENGNKVVQKVKVLDFKNLPASKGNDLALGDSIKYWDKVPSTENLRFYVLTGNLQVSVGGENKTVGWGFSDEVRKEMEEKGGRFVVLCDNYDWDTGKHTERRIIAFVAED